MEKENIFFCRRRKTQKEKEENIWRRPPKDIEKSRFRSRDFCQLGFGIGFGEFGLGKKVSVSVSENLVSGKKFRFRKIWSQKSLDFGFGKLGLGKEKSK